MDKEYKIPEAFRDLCKAVAIVVTEASHKEKS